MKLILSYFYLFNVSIALIGYILKNNCIINKQIIINTISLKNRNNIIKISRIFFILSNNHLLDQLIDMQLIFYFSLYQIFLYIVLAFLEYLKYSFLIRNLKYSIVASYVAILTVAKLFSLSINK